MIVLLQMRTGLRNKIKALTLIADIKVIDFKNSLRPRNQGDLKNHTNSVSYTHLTLPTKRIV